MKVRTKLFPHVELDVDEIEYRNLATQGLLVEDEKATDKAAVGESKDGEK